ncbi:hypothetical protein IQ63_29710 [Streptomyces acidiscabies]|uniref:Uncharacterized protein n=1 Tax=Streptomyces acidiscabies TaxID=42234 RepID=A0A0L0JXW6_9ACTN|nr:hypothetical protein IQ63_29710 [Streptomyces acidiscabies]
MTSRNPASPQCRRHTSTTRTASSVAPAFSSASDASTATHGESAASGAAEPDAFRRHAFSAASAAHDSAYAPDNAPNRAR